MKKLIALLALMFAAVFALTACSSSAEPLTLGPDAVVVDVRTPSEYSEGHLEGAVNIDVQSPDFASILSQLPTDGEYYVYCRSGNRSAAAVEQMKAAGFTNVTDGGSKENASAATGIPIVQ